MPKYIVNPLCFEEFHFLRIRTSPSLGYGDNVKYKIYDSDFRNVEVDVDDDASTKDWYKVKSVTFPSGRSQGGEGWMVKVTGNRNTPTLSPKPLKNLRPNTADVDPDIDNAMGNEAFNRTQKRELQGAGGLNPLWMRQSFADPNNRRIQCPNGMAAWQYPFDGFDAATGWHVRIVMRHGIVADAGYGMSVAAALHAAVGVTAGVAATAVGCNGVGMPIPCNGLTADVVLIFLKAIPGAVERHKKAGYTVLEEGPETWMYHQEAKAGRYLSESDVRRLKKQYVE